MTPLEVLTQQLLTGLSNGMIIALIALGYTMVYGIVELINFAHGDLFMVGCYFALTLVGVLGAASGEGTTINSTLSLCALLALTPIFCGTLNWIIDRLAYRPLRKSTRLAPLVSAIGVSFILLNVGLFWGGIPMEVFNQGTAAASPKDFPSLLSAENLLGDSMIYLSAREVLVAAVTIPILTLLVIFIKFSKTGKAMRAVAQSPSAAALMGIDVNKIIGRTFILGGALGGFASVIYALYNNTIHFQMGFRVGMDAFTAAVLGGIGSLPGAMCGGLLIGILRSLSDQYIATEWTNTVVFAVLILVLLLKPSGILGSNIREKV